MRGQREGPGRGAVWAEEGPEVRLIDSMLHTHVGCVCVCVCVRVGGDFKLCCYWRVKCQK